MNMLITLDPMGRVMAEPKGEVSRAGELDPTGLGFMCGLEVHQQLATGKLHSRQDSKLHDVTIDSVPDEWRRVKRRLHIAQGESGKVDVAARFEARRSRRFVYIQSPNSGLIELDDQPPEAHDVTAVDVALTIAGLMQAHPVPLLQTMRKTVVDGSNTSGFQRTTLVATNGVIPTEAGDVGVDVICLEEDSARKLATESNAAGEIVTWNLDRLGIPLVEIATAPDVQTPEHAKQTAIAMGALLRDTRSVRRGLGSIRQDLNVSIACGDRVEIKGCQDLEWIPRIIRLEMARQLHFYRLANELRDGLNLPPLPNDRRETDSDIEIEVAARLEQEIPLEISDVGSVFSACESKMVVESMAAGAVMLAIKLPHLEGRLGIKTFDDEGAQLPRLGRELASAAKLAGVAGIFHSDELPAYGISQTEVDATKAALGVGNGDGFALCCASAWQAELALESVVDRARMAWHRIPQEVRNVVVSKGEPVDGTTTAMRPLPGGARMYPETDIPPLALSAERWQGISSNLPPSRSQREQALVGKGISNDQIMQLLDRQLDDEFHQGISGNLLVGLSKLPPKTWASTLLDTTRQSIEAAVANSVDEFSSKASKNGSKIPLSVIAIAISLRESDEITREGIIPMCAEMLTSGAWPQSEPSTKDATNALSAEMANRAESRGFKPAAAADLASIVDQVVTERADFIAERGMAAMGPLMGVVMAAAGGAADGKVVSQLLGDAIRQRL